MIARVRAQSATRLKCATHLSPHPGEKSSGGSSDPYFRCPDHRWVQVKHALKEVSNLNLQVSRSYPKTVHHLSDLSKCDKSSCGGATAPLQPRPLAIQKKNICERLSHNKAAPQKEFKDLQVVRPPWRTRRGTRCTLDKYALDLCPLRRVSFSSLPHTRPSLSRRDEGKGPTWKKEKLPRSRTSRRLRAAAAARTCYVLAWWCGLWPASNFLAVSWIGQSNMQTK